MVFRILAGKPGQTSSAGGPRLQLRAAQPTVCIEDCKTNRFCYNWVHTALSFLFVGKIFEITTGAKCVISSLSMKHISLKNNFLTYKINSKLSTEYHLNSVGSIFMCYIAKFQVVQVQLECVIITLNTMY